MENTSKLGMNRTGVQMAPKLTQEMLEGARQAGLAAEGDASALHAARLKYIQEADLLGSVPVPGSAKGVLKSGAQMLTGNRPQALVDKLSERLAFERTGTRLWDGLILKYHGGGDGTAIPDVSLERLEQFRNDEAQHMVMVAEAIHALGADPTAQTPSADLVGVQGMGLVQAVTDPRTTFAQSLQAILAAELIDNDGWENLVLLVENAGQKEIAERFRTAFEQEQVHLDHVRRWYATLTLGEARVGSPS